MARLKAQIVNPKQYSTRIATNVRLDADLKLKAIAKAQKTKRNLADYINDLIREDLREGE